ncbi:MAG: hypothetical protein J6R99_02725 [Alphaproteobacteria bacterium]|nr:hypothetical protein [Alphaproteobacteria bacterium]MBO7066599.1 hypothetical protein [Alphaproteobacteria bacterium]
MKHTICITYDDSEIIGWGNVVDAETGTYTAFTWDKNHEWLDESPDTDCEDFNDNARWLIKTLLAILEMEKQDPNAHCDWSADYDHDERTGKYKFHVSIDRIKDEQ